MGLIKAGLGALGGTLADQWKEFFYCESLSNDVLVTKGTKRVGGRSSNTKGSDNIISNGSGIAVADGQCMIIVEQGKVVEVCAEPVEFTYDSSTEPSLCGCARTAEHRIMENSVRAAVHLSLRYRHSVQNVATNVVGCFSPELLFPSSALSAVTP